MAQDPKKVPQNREEGIQKGIDEATKEGRRAYEEGIPFVRYLDMKMSQGMTYEPRAKKAMGEEYKKAKAEDKAKPVKKKSGGLLKAAPNEGVTKLPKDVRNKMGFLKKGGKVKGYKNGGKVKKCRMDGIALRGKTRAKQRSK
jgi:hypothetical protein